MPDSFDFRRLSEMMGSSAINTLRDDSRGYNYDPHGYYSYSTYASHLFRSIDEHLRECRFFNGLSIARSRNLPRRSYRQPSDHVDRYRGYLVLLRCSCGWEMPVSNEVYNLQVYGCDFEDLIADANYRIVSGKGAVCFEDEIKKVIDSYKRSEKQTIRRIHKEVKSRFLKPLEGLEV